MEPPCRRRTARPSALLCVCVCVCNRVDRDVSLKPLFVTGLATTQAARVTSALKAHNDRVVLLLSEERYVFLLLELDIPRIPTNFVPAATPPRYVCITKRRNERWLLTESHEALVVQKRRRKLANIWPWIYTFRERFPLTRAAQMFQHAVPPPSVSRRVCQSIL